MAPFRPSPLIANLALALLCLIWGSTWLVIRTGLDDMPPLTSAAIRFTLASAVFLAVAPALSRREGGDPPAWWLSLVMGSLNFAAAYGILYWAETVIPSSLASVLWAVFPMLMAISGHFFLPGERLSTRHWAGFGLGFLGVVLLFQTDLRNIAPGALVVGLVVLLSPLVSAVGQTCVKRYGEGTSSLLLNRNSILVGAVLLWAIALPLEHDTPIAWTASAILSILYLALAGTCVTFGLYYWLLRYYPSHRLSLIAYVIPVIALFLGWALGDEPVGLRTLGGAALILGGVGLVAERKRPASAA